MVSLEDAFVLSPLAMRERNRKIKIFVFIRLWF
jgi:hypothetical protein